VTTQPFELPDGQALLVTGSLSAKQQDRWLERSAIRPVSIIRTHEGTPRVDPVAGFDHVGDLGVGSMAWDERRDRLWFSTGPDLWLADLTMSTCSRVEIPDLVDTHEIDIFGDDLWIANSGRDEVVQVSLETQSVVNRTDLGKFRSGAGTAVSGADRFHMNQLFDDHQGHMWGLVHHVEGRQFLKKVATRVVKAQGDGGVINVETGETLSLRLTAPHSVVVCAQGYWVFDSGQRLARRYSKTWDLESTVPTWGWGRGADIDAPSGVLYCGMSPIRKRYLGIVAGPADESAPLVEAFAINTGDMTGRVEVGTVEQINNVYLLPVDVCDAICALEPST